MSSKRQGSNSRSPRRSVAVPELEGVQALVVNLDRRPDRWERCEKMLKEETPWLKYERFSASDGSQMTIPENEVCVHWNTKCNAKYGDYDEWVFDAPDNKDLDGVHWKWPDAVNEADKEWSFTADDDDSAKATVVKVSSGERFNVRKTFASRFLEPGLVQRMSGGERGCAHSHRRIWEVAARRAAPTLVLEDDAQFVFDRSDDNGRFNGKLLTERLVGAVKEAPADFDILYLGWSGWRGGNFKHLDEEDDGEFIRKVEYVWTTVAYLITPVAAAKLLNAGSPIDQPVDNFMAWEASQGRLKSFVIIDESDEDHLWAGGICDQVDFQGDSDIKKSDGGVQGDDCKDFAVDTFAVEPALAAVACKGG